MPDLTGKCGARRRTAPRLLMLMLIGLVGCSGREDRPAGGNDAPAAEVAAPATPVARPNPVSAVSPQVASMPVDLLREAAARSLHDNRMYAPAGNNAVEYYLALRDKQPSDASVNSALTDLMPYTLIAAEQSIVHEEFPEAQRLIALIERADAQAPALPRLKADVSRGIELASVRDAARIGQETQQRAQPESAQRALAERQARDLAAARPPAAPPPPERPQPAAANEQRSAASREPEQRDDTPRLQPPDPATAVAPSLRPINTPAPRYPPEALRSGTAGELLVEITVGTDGSVTSSRVLRAIPPRVFDREALNAIKRWRFEPVPAPVTTRRTLSFEPGN